MKKYLGTILSLLFFVIVIVLSIIIEKSSIEKDAIKVYVFYREECQYCEKLKDYLKDLKDDKEYGNLFEEVDFDLALEENKILLQTVSKHFDTDVTGVPFYVIGEKYYTGYAESRESTIKTAIKDAYDDKNYIDVISLIKDNQEITKPEDNNNSQSGMILLAIFSFIIFVINLASIKNNKKQD